MRQAVLAGGQTTRQGFEVFERVAHIVFHRRRGGLVHQREQSRADVVVQVLRNALALFVAATFNGQVVGHGAPQLFNHAVSQARVLDRKNALAMARVAQL